MWLCDGTPEEDDKIEIIHVFVLYVFLDDVKVKGNRLDLETWTIAYISLKDFRGKESPLQPTASLNREARSEGVLMDPASAMALASASFATIKKGFAIGRDVESMMSDIGRWMGALSDLDQAEKEAKNPPILRNLFVGKSVEQEAMEVFAAKRKAQAQRDELKQWISLTLGHVCLGGFDQDRGKDIRKQRQETLYAAAREASQVC